MKKTINWGIIGLGGIAHKFAEGLRSAENVKLQGVASSNKERALEFAKKHDVEFYGSYEELSANPDIDVVYIASYNTQHFEHSKLCLENGKHVLCEKPLTTNTKDSEELFLLAKEKGLFFMEALWTRFHPSIAYLEQLVASGKYGNISQIDVTFGYVAPNNPNGRLLNTELGGGALLDIGIYPLFLTNLLLGKPNKIKAEVEYGVTGVDMESKFVYEYDSAVSNMMCSFKQVLDNQAIITFENAKVVLKSMWHCPTDVILITDKEENIPMHWKGNGYNYEAQFVTDLLLQNQYTQDILPNEFSLELIRQIENLMNNYKFI